MKRALTWCCAVALLGGVSSCASGATGNGITVTDEPAGANCAEGGLRIDVGPDSDANGIPDTVTSTSYVCDGASAGTAAVSLTNVATEAPGANCAEGGVRIETGPDADGSGTLDASEVAATEYACNGADGMGGAGASSLTDVTAEAAGANCAEGGVRIDNGLDADGSGTLDSTEVTSTEYICDGANGTGGTVSDVIVEPAGSNCGDGGVRIRTGPDTNVNGMLDSSEVTGTSYVCNGDPTAAFGATPVVSAFDGGSITSTGTATVTTQAATITVPRAGTVLAIASLEVYCDPSGAPLCASSGDLDGYFSLSTSATGSASGGAYSYFFLAPDTSENLTRNAVFEVGAGTHTVYGRARNDNSAGGGQMGFYRRQLTLVFIPSD